MARFTFLLYVKTPKVITMFAVRHAFYGCNMFLLGSMENLEHILVVVAIGALINICL